MPATRPTIVTPLPNDPRVMRLAKATALPRREAFGAAAEAWAWLAHHAVDGIVPATEPDALDVAINVPGIGQAMLAAGLVGVVNDGLVLPGELRRELRQRDDAEPRGRHRGDDAGDDARKERRRGQWRRSKRDRRATNKLTAPKTQPTTSKPCRSLGRVAGREVRIYDGPHGCYARVIGATLDGQNCAKFTAGDKAWSLEDVTLVDVLPALVEKWKRLTAARGLADPPRAEPTYDAFREDAERLTMLEQFTRAEAAGGGDGRVVDMSTSPKAPVDMSTTVHNVSTTEPADAERKALCEQGFPLRHVHTSGVVDTHSSSSLSSKSSSSVEEEDMRGGREAGSIDDDKPAAYREWEAKRQRTAERDARIAAALGIDIGTVRSRYRDYLALQCRQAGIDFRTGLPLDAGGSHEPAGARTTLPATAEPMDDAEPATSSVVARERDGPQHDTRTALAVVGATVTPRRVDDIGDDDAVTQHDRDTLRQGA